MGVVVESRRAKYVGVSKLTEDYLDTSGVLATFEGELEDEAPLSSLSILRGDGGDYFQWGSGAKLDSTFTAQHFDPKFKMAYDWDDRFYQYHDNFNDRAWDSPACINDGECPVNFKRQTSGAGMFSKATGAASRSA